MIKSQLSNCEKSFLVQAISEKKRLDGREFTQYRDVKITFGIQRGCCHVIMGNTRVLAQISASIEAPKQSRPTEGLIFVNVELSPMAAPHFEAGRQSDQGVEITRILERCIKESRCVDTESLCIMAGVKVWSIRADLHVLNHDGNLIDACSMAAISALAHFRRPDVTVSGEEVTIHAIEDRDPVPLSVHHMPLCVTFGFYEQGKYLLVDPTLKEELVMDGKMVIGMNKHREICTLQMTGSMLLLKDQILRCSQIAVVKVTELTALLQRALENDTQARARGEKFGFAVMNREKTVTTTVKEDMEVDTSSLPQKSDGEDTDHEGAIDEFGKQLEDEEEAEKAKFEASVITKSKDRLTIGEGGKNKWDEDGGWDIQAPEKGDSSQPKKRTALNLPKPKFTETDSPTKEIKQKEPSEPKAAKPKPLKPQKGRFIGGGGHIDLSSALKSSSKKS